MISWSAERIISETTSRLHLVLGASLAGSSLSVFDGESHYKANSLQKFLEDRLWPVFSKAMESKDSWLMTVEAIGFLVGNYLTTLELEVSQEIRPEEVSFSGADLFFTEYGHASKGHVSIEFM